MTGRDIAFHPCRCLCRAWFIHTTTGDKKEGRIGSVCNKPSSFSEVGRKMLPLACLCLSERKGRGAWGEVSTFSAYLTCSCLMFRNSTRLNGSRRRGSTRIHRGSAYMNLEEFPILILARPLTIRQFIINTISLLSCRIVSISQYTVFSLLSS